MANQAIRKSKLMSRLDCALESAADGSLRTSGISGRYIDNGTPLGLIVESASFEFVA